LEKELDSQPDSSSILAPKKSAGFPAVCPLESPGQRKGILELNSLAGNGGKRLVLLPHIHQLGEAFRFRKLNIYLFKYP
jgi:hypothetical protein